MNHLPDYSSRDLIVSWIGGIIDGLAPDSAIEFSRSVAVTEAEVGADGKVSISILPDETGVCTISLQQQSLSNAILAGVLEAQQRNRRIYRGSLTISDPSGAMVVELEDAHIQEAPTFGFGSSANGSTRDWVFFCERMKFRSNSGSSLMVAADTSFIQAQIDAIINIG